MVMTVKIKFKNSKILLDVVDALNAIIDETIINLTPDAFIITAMDPSRICMLEFLIKKEDFEIYQCDKNYNLGLDLDDIWKILKRKNDNESLEFIFEEAEQRIKIKMRDEEKDRVRTFRLSLIDVEVTEIPIESLFEIDFPSTVILNTKTIDTAVKDGEIYSEYITITAEEKVGITFSAIGQIGSMDTIIGIDTLIKPILVGIVSASYGIKYLKAILRASSLMTLIKISLKTDYPIKMVFKFNDYGILYFFLAPRVDDD
jgi:proliferating cell nuclear antigen PCNA